MPAQIEIRAEVRPASPFRLPRGGMDGVARRRGGVLERLLHVGGEPVVLRAAQPALDRVVMGAWAPTREAAEAGLARLRFGLGVDDDLGPFLREFRDDPLDRRVGPPGALDPPAAQGRRVRGAGLGGLRAAHRVRARDRDRAQDRPPPRSPM